MWDVRRREEIGGHGHKALGMSDLCSNNFHPPSFSLRRLWKFSDAVKTRLYRIHKLDKREGLFSSTRLPKWKIGAPWDNVGLMNDIQSLFTSVKNFLPEDFYFYRVNLENHMKLLWRRMRIRCGSTWPWNIMSMVFLPCHFHTQYSVSYLLSMCE